MVIFFHYFKKHLIKIYTKLHHLLKNFSEEVALEHLCHAQHAMSRHAYITSGKIICMPLLNPVMYAHLPFVRKNHNKKRSTFPNV